MSSTEKIMSNILGSTHRNPFGDHHVKEDEYINARGVTGRLKPHQMSWALIDKKFGISHVFAEHHRKTLEYHHGTMVKKILANFKLKEWHFYAKVR